MFTVVVTCGVWLDWPIATEARKPEPAASTEPLTISVASRAFTVSLLPGDVILLPLRQPVRAES
jgi:hypothetical protein